MQVTVIPRTEEIVSTQLIEKNVVVIDVLRATSTMVTALNNGAARIAPFISAEEAHAWYRLVPEDTLLCGERGGRKLPGFHLGNSPAEYGPETVRHKSLAMTTTNGTRTIQACKGAAEIFIGCALNAPSVGRRLCASSRDIILACAGTEGKFSLDDFAVAGLIIKLMRQWGTVSEQGDAAAAAVMLARRYSIEELLFKSYHGGRLVGMGYEQDVSYCSQVGIIDLVPYFDGKLIVRD